MQHKKYCSKTITNRTTDIMMKKFLMLYAFLMTALSLFAREDRVSNFEQLMRLDPHRRNRYGVVLEARL